jgi:hypothetical protein
VASNRVAAVAPPSYDGPYRPPVSNNAVPGDPRIQGLTPEEARKLVALWHHDDSERYQRRRRQVKQWHATHPHTPPPRADEL